jgi:hemoglobin
MPNRGPKYTAIIGGVSQGEALGITPDEIQKIVYGFYTKVREDELLGPVFENEMSEDWDGHLIKMCNFWTAVMFGKSAYKGNPLEVHRRIANLSRAHFEHWLLVFKATLSEVRPSLEHIDAFYGRASNMARVMSGALVLKVEPIKASAEI